MAFPARTRHSGVGWDNWDWLASDCFHWGTYLIAVTGNFGFLAPVLAKQSPVVLDSINRYAPW